METLRALIRGDLAPAGYPISLEQSDSPNNLFSQDYQTHWLDSGTSALAVALLDCKLRAPDISQPQVIIPSYCCPDLVAAAVYAGVEPLVVDIEENDPAYDLTQLESALNPRVISVIAINFLGIKERLTEIRSLLQKFPQKISLIEDNAQWFPDTPTDIFESDYIAFSFGRGKPLSLLGGGALLTKTELHPSINLAEGEKSGFKTRMKMVAYNALLNPHLYCFLNRAPFLHLGETRYHPLTAIAEAPDRVKPLFAENYIAYQQRSLSVEDSYQKNFRAQQRLQSIYSGRKGCLLRYPFLFKTPEACASAYQQLSSAGLGASRLYQQSLDKIEGVDGKLQCFSDLVNAKQFASRLLTLPVHQFVKDGHIEKIVKIVTSFG